MHVVVNHIPIKPGADWGEMCRLFNGFGAELRPGHPEILAMQIVKASEEEAILLISFSDEATMTDFSRNVAGPWFAENIRPFLAGPADRKTGAVVAGFPS
jgi:hypothetical protein